MYRRVIHFSNTFSSSVLCRAMIQRLFIVNIYCATELATKVIIMGSPMYKWNFNIDALISWILYKCLKFGTPCFPSHIYIWCHSVHHVLYVHQTDTVAVTFRFLISYLCIQIYLGEGDNPIWFYCILLSIEWFDEKRIDKIWLLNSKIFF